MRNRSRTTFRLGTRSPFITNTVYPYMPDLDSKSTGFVGDDAQLLKEDDSVIEDVIALRPEVRVDPVTGSWKRIKYRKIPYASGRLGANSAKLLRPNHPCHHVKTRVEYPKDITVVDSRTIGSGPPFERTITRTVDHADGASVIKDNISFTPDPSTVAWSSSSGFYTASDFRVHDWFALTSSFNEACDQFIPSNLMVGEDIAENAIFVEAFKAVLNPTRAVARLIKAGLQSGRKVRKMNLGQASRYISKNSANTFLGYNFGVKPAVEDIEKALHSHRKVRDRMAHLHRNAGRFVPIRVRSELWSDVSNVPLSAPLSLPETGYEWQCVNKVTTATIGAYGRVREDLNFEDTWSAYLQYFGINKILGLAWELIPFSFLLDWFTNTQEYINFYGRLNAVSPFTELTRLWASEKRETWEQLYCIPGYSPSRQLTIESPVDPFVVANRYITDYSRYITIPDVSGVVDLSALGLFHSLASASLIVQQIPR